MSGVSRFIKLDNKYFVARSSLITALRSNSQMKKLQGIVMSKISDFIGKSAVENVKSIATSA